MEFDGPNRVRNVNDHIEFVTRPYHAENNNVQYSKPLASQISHWLFQTSSPRNQLIFRQQECQIDPSNRVASVSLNDRPIVIRRTTVRLTF
jgi:hypothetical protein